jgi:hypothetical protein
MRYQFIHQDGELLVNVSSDATSLGEVLDHFERFLKAAGFCFDGHLQIEAEPETTEDT